jgi:hypothetical protein
MFQWFTCGVIEGPELPMPSLTLNRNFWTINYTTCELLDPQFHHMGTSGPSITPHMNFLTLNYTTWELLNPQLHHKGTSV